MFRLRLSVIIVLILALAVLSGGIAYAAQSENGAAASANRYKEKAAAVKDKIDKRITQADREAAAERAAAAGFVLPTAETAAMVEPGMAPYYFTHPNYANSQWPTVSESNPIIHVGNALVARAYATDFVDPPVTPVPVFVVVPTPLPNGLIQSFDIFNQVAPGGSPGPSAGNSFNAYVLRPTGVLNEYLVVYDSGPLTVPTPVDPVSGGEEHFAVPNIAVQTGDVLGFYGAGIPVDIDIGADIFSYPAAPAPAQDATVTLGGAEYPLFGQARTYSFGATLADLSTVNVDVTGGIRKFVDTLPGLGSGAANNLGQYIPVAVADTTTYPGSDYYEIAVIQYREQMHSDLQPTLLRGYVQLSTSVVPGAQVPLSNAMLDGSTVPTGRLGVTPPHYLGPVISATKDRPVRIKFVNLLPTGLEGNLFIPVDSTVMGSGMGPNMPMTMEDDPQNPMAGMIPKPYEAYTENRATLHLHGGISPWISDGTPHQWITPAGENTPYPEGVSVRDVPDMATPEPGAMTFYYTNQQSARLMFYHDHAWGITRLNVYAGEAAPYLIKDATEQMLIDQQLIPGADATIPLVIQDKTFVPDDMQLMLQDNTWNATRWGGAGNLWMPHVYSPAQNPGDPSGVNQFGRWAYGPWFWPPTLDIKYGPIANPYYGGAGEPALMPGTPYTSMGMESFFDTPVVNGTAYPTTTVEPKAYRLRVLNAANDRFFNLSLYVADATGTEVALNAAEVAAALEDTTVFPTPDTDLSPAGPDWVQIGTEGGFLPAPVVIPAHPTTWVNDPTVFNAGNVDQHSLLLAPAERADVIVDFSQYAGQTLILYNDAPAAFPARDPRYDYYTGDADLRDTGGAPSTLPGYGPNTRTVMQIVVGGPETVTTPSNLNLTALETAFRSVSLGGQGVFENGQNPIVVGQAAYNSAYGTSFTGNDGIAQIFDTSLTFKTILGDMLTMPLQPKMIQDEMGEAFDREYGRMSGFLGVETPNAQAGLQNMILYPYTSPPTEILKGIDLPPDVEITPIASADDGSQLWKITHNGVDTHPIHVHLYDAQLVNRVGWDGIVRMPDANELGWKDTFRVSPLEDTIIALRPIVPNVPFDLPNSIRLINPMMPDGAILEDTAAQEAAGLPLMAFNPDGEPIDVVNHFVNFGFEYVYHCHILSHEEMDMMHSQVVGVAPLAPDGLQWVLTGNGNNKRNVLTWNDNSKNETDFVIERSVAGTGIWTVLATVPSDKDLVGPGTGTRTYEDVVGNSKDTYEYQVYAVNTVGDTWDYANPAFNNIVKGGFPILTLDSRGGSSTGVAAPTNLTGGAVQKNNKTATVTLNWTDNSLNETGFLVQRADNVTFSLGVVNTEVLTDVTTFSQTVTRGRTFYYRVLAFNMTSASGWSNPATVIAP